MIVLDEPNTYLDSEAEQDLMAAIAAAKQEGTTIIVISHRPAMASIADKVLVLREGAVDSFGPPEDAAVGTRKLVAIGSRDNSKIAHFPLARIGQS